MCLFGRSEFPVCVLWRSELSSFWSQGGLMRTCTKLLSCTHVCVYLMVGVRELFCFFLHGSIFWGYMCCVTCTCIVHVHTYSRIRYSVTHRYRHILLSYMCRRVYTCAHVYAICIYIRIYMYMCVCVWVCMHVCMCLCRYICICTCIYIYIYIHTYVFWLIKFPSVCLSVFLSVCLCVCHVCMYVCMCVCV
jgi:hypothetical protein